MYGRGLAAMLAATGARLILAARDVAKLRGYLIGDAGDTKNAAIAATAPIARLLTVADAVAELENAGLEDWLAEETLLVVEWGERFPEALPEDRLDVSIRGGELPASRILTASARGPWSRALAERWSSRWR